MEKSTGEGLETLEQKAAENDPEALATLAEWHETGRYVDGTFISADAQKAQQYWYRAAEAGHKVACARRDRYRRERRRQEMVDELSEGVGLTAAWVAGAGFVGAVITLAIQIVTWLKTATWTPMPFWKGLDWLGLNFDFLYQIEWKGIQAILVWILELPLSLVLIAIGIMLGVVIAIAGQSLVGVLASNDKR